MSDTSENKSSQNVKDLPRLTRAAHGRPAAPERIVHIGCGNFHRAHEAWYTQHAPNASEWGIVEFGGHSDHMRDKLAPQGNVYTLVEAGPNPDKDKVEVISSISAFGSVANMDDLLSRFENPKISIVSTTVTEAGYCADANRQLNTTDPQIKKDIAALKADPRSHVVSMPARVVAGLLARRKAGAGKITLLPCDNIAGNGALMRSVIEGMIRETCPDLLSWERDNVSWASTMVDRITPATTQTDIDQVAQRCGWRDAAPVRCEPYIEWVIQGDFPAGRPAWDAAGAQFVKDVTPYEQRKLWMLNGSHTTLAYTGSVLGHESIYEAVRDPLLLRWINQWWDLAGSYLSVPSDQYRAKLLERFRNPGIHHHLLQIGTDGSTKLPQRIVPVALKALKDGKSVEAPARTLAAWDCYLRDLPEEDVHDVNKKKVLALARSGSDTALRDVVAFINKDLAGSSRFMDQVRACVQQIEKVRSQKISAR